MLGNMHWMSEWKWLFLHAGAFHFMLDDVHSPLVSRLLVHFLGLI